MPRKYLFIAILCVWIRPKGVRDSVTKWRMGEVRGSTKVSRDTFLAISLKKALKNYFFCKTWVMSYRVIGDGEISKCHMGRRWVLNLPKKVSRIFWMAPQVDKFADFPKRLFLYFYKIQTLISKFVSTFSISIIDILALGLVLEFRFIYCNKNVFNLKSYLI